MNHIIIAGGSGFIGMALAKYFLENKYRVTILSRNPARENQGIRYVLWDGKTVSGSWAGCLNNSLAIINLTGKNIDCRFNKKNRQEILSSRINSVAVIGEAIRQCEVPPKIWIQASAIAYYGDTGSNESDENSPAGSGFLADVCQQWEDVTLNQVTPHTVKSIIRIGLVLAKHGGVLPKLKRMARFGLGGTVGNGKQWMAWIHINDLVWLVEWLLTNSKFNNIYNAVTPYPIQNKEFMKTLRRSLNIKFAPPAPVAAVKVGSFLMGSEASLVLQSSRIFPRRLLKSGFNFNYARLFDALTSNKIRS